MNNKKYGTSLYSDPSYSSSNVSSSIHLEELKKRYGRLQSEGYYKK